MTASPLPRAVRQRAVLAYLEAAHRQGRPGVPPRELLPATRSTWAVLDRMVARCLIGWTEAGLCLPAFRVRRDLPPGVVPFRRRAP